MINMLLFTLGRIVSIVILLWACDKHSYSYYTLLRFIVCGVSIYGILIVLKSKKQYWAWCFGIIAILFNPIIPIHLDRNTWRFIDIAVAIIFATSLFLLTPISPYMERVRKYIAYLFDSIVVYLFPLLMIGAGSFALYYNIQDFLVHKAILNAPVVVEGAVTKVEVDNGDPETPPSDVVTVEYSFGNKVYHEDYAAECSQVRIGDKITLTFNRNNPEQVEFGDITIPTPWYSYIFVLIIWGFVLLWTGGWIAVIIKTAIGK